MNALLQVFSNQCRQQHGREDGDNRDDNQQFNECEQFASHFLFSFFVLFVLSVCIPFECDLYYIPKKGGFNGNNG